MYKVLAEHVETFIAQMENEGKGLPEFVINELRGFLRCGNKLLKRHGSKQRFFPKFLGLSNGLRLMVKMNQTFESLAKLEAPNLVDSVISALGRLSYVCLVAAGVYDLSILNFYLTGYKLGLGTGFVFLLFSSIVFSGQWISTTNFATRNRVITAVLLAIPALYGSMFFWHIGRVFGLVYAGTSLGCFYRVFWR